MTQRSRKILTWLLTCTVAGSSLGEFSLADEISPPKSKNRKAVVARAQNSDSPATLPKASPQDEEIFDRHLVPVPADRKSKPAQQKNPVSKQPQTVAVANLNKANSDVEAASQRLSQSNFQATTTQSAPCVLPIGPNCTDINPNSPPMNPSDPTNTPSTLPPSTTPSMEPPSTLNQPSALNQQMQSLPNLEAGQAVASSSVVPFIGDFFGGSTQSSSATSPIVGQVALTSGGLVQIVGGQTTSTPATFSTNGSFTLDGQSGNFVLNGQNGTFTLGNQSGILTVNGQVATFSIAGQSGTIAYNGQSGIFTFQGQSTVIPVTFHNGVPTLNGTTGTVPISGQNEPFAIKTTSETYTINGQTGLRMLGVASPAIVNGQPVQIFDLQQVTHTGGLDPAVTTGRTKLAEGSSPIPRDRVFFNFSNFNDVDLTGTSITVNRYTPGFEKTFFNGNASVEVRAPFASTLTTNIDTTTGFVNPTDMQFGNLTLYTKALLYQTPTFAYSTGLGFTLPTASNVNVYSGNTQVLHISNDAVHLLPFIGGVYTPNNRFFTQGICQFDLDTNGNRVRSNVDAYGNPAPAGDMTSIGTYRDSAFLYASASAGYWIYRNPTPNRFGLTGFAPTGELHYNRNLQNGNVLNGNFGGVVSTIYGTNYTNLEVLNAVMGANMLFGRNRIMTVGYTTPLGMGVDKQFASEFRVMFNWYFGGGNSSPLTRAGGVQF